MSLVLENEYQKYYQMYGDLFLKELELESLAKTEAEQHLKATLEKMKVEGEAGQGLIASKLTGFAWETSRENIRALIKQVKENNTRGVKSSWFFLMEDLLTVFANREEDLENLLVLTGHSKTLDSLLNTNRDRCHTLSYISMAFGNSIKREANI